MEAAGTTTPMTVYEQPRVALIPTEQTTNSAFALAKLAAASGLCKTKKPEDAFFVIMHGYEIGIPAMTALRTIHIINGVPVTSGEALLAIIRRSNKVDIKIEGSATTATVWMKRRDSGEEYKATWTIERAAIAGLTKKQTWVNFPQAFLQWRGVGECSKFLCSDITNGLYPAEEIAPDLNYDESGELLTVQTITISKPEPDEPGQPTQPPAKLLAWFEQPYALTDLAFKAYEKLWIEEQGEAGVKELEAIIAPRTWDNFSDRTAAALYIKQVVEDAQAEIARAKQAPITTEDAKAMLGNGHERRIPPAVNIPHRPGESDITEQEAVNLLTGNAAPAITAPDSPFSSNPSPDIEAGIKAAAAKLAADKTEQKTIPFKPMTFAHIEADRDAAIFASKETD